VALGFVEIAWALFCVFGGLLLGLIGLVDDQTGLLMLLGSGVYGILAVFAGLVGTLHVVTGMKLRSGTGLMWALASMAGGLASLVLALYCSPFTLVVLLYAAVVIGNSEVREALDPSPA
jgi:hypothetical protein